jgi:C1A family cysteine protease
MTILVQRGIKLDSVDGHKDKVDPDQSVCCYHINGERDEELGYPLSKYNLNYVFEPPDERDYKFKNTLVRAIHSGSLPSSVDLRPDWGDIYDQGDVGSCVAQSVAYQIRHLLRKTVDKKLDMSRLFIYYNGRVISNFPVTEDTGMTMRNGFRSVTAYGAPDEILWPHVLEDWAKRPSDDAYREAANNRNITYFAVDQNLLEMKKCLKDGFAISFGMMLFDSFMSTEVARTGKVPIPDFDKEQRIGGHAMTIIGYNDADETFTVVNSWGKAWGDGGSCHIPYSLVLNRRHTGDLWTPRSFRLGPTAPVAPAPPVVDDIKHPKWAPNISYKMGDIVSHLDKLYRCSLSHRSITLWAPNVIPALWRKI